MSLINFDSYGSSPAPPRRRRGRGWLAGAVGLAVLLVVILGFRLVAGHSTRSAGPPSTAPAADLGYAQVRQQGACLDGLTPTPDGWAQRFAADIRSAVAHLADWENALGSPPTDGNGTPSPGLNLWVKAVYTNSLSTENPQYTAHALVPSVAALTVRLPLTSDYNDPAYESWNRALASVKNDWAAAKVGAGQGDAALAGLQFPPHDSTLSGISGCISGLLHDVPPVMDPDTHQPDPRSFLIATDCNEPVAPQLDGDFHGDALYVIQSCVSGNAEVCGRYFQQFSDRMQALHVGRIVQIPADQADQAVTAWVQTGRWPS
jgi:hypothetical protein